MAARRRRGNKKANVQSHGIEITTMCGTHMIETDRLHTVKGAECLLEFILQLRFHKTHNPKKRVKPPQADVRTFFAAERKLFRFRFQHSVFL